MGVTGRGGDITQAANPHPRTGASGDSVALCIRLTPQPRLITSISADRFDVGGAATAQVVVSNEGPKDLTNVFVDVYIDAGEETVRDPREGRLVRIGRAGGCGIEAMETLYWIDVAKAGTLWDIEGRGWRTFETLRDFKFSQVRVGPGRALQRHIPLPLMYHWTFSAHSVEVGVADMIVRVTADQGWAVARFRLVKLDVRETAEAVRGWFYVEELPPFGGADEEGPPSSWLPRRVDLFPRTHGGPPAARASRPEGEPPPSGGQNAERGPARPAVTLLRRTQRQ